MTDKERNLSERRQHPLFLFTDAISVLIASGLVGCSPSTKNLEAVDYTPLPGDDGKVSTPAEQGLAPPQSPSADT